MKEQELQLELERFKQKANWEKTIFYFSLTALWAIILTSFKDGIKIWGLDLIWWILILGILMSLGEFFIQSYLDTQANILRKKILGKDSKTLDENKLRSLVGLEKKRNKRKNNFDKIDSKIETLKKEIWGKE